MTAATTCRVRSPRTCARTSGALVYETVIPRNVRLSEAPSHAMPAIIYDRTSSGAIAYQKLAAELLAQLRKERPLVEQA